MHQPIFPPPEVSIKLAIAVAIGMLIGLEREWSQKDLGTRTFAITAMAGCISVLASAGFAYITFGGVLVIVALTGIRNLTSGRPVETTTSAALIATFILGVLVGQGNHYTPVASAIVITMLLSLKPALTHFAGGLQVNEVRSAVLLGLLAFVIYPILPNYAIDPWGLVNPREAWLTVVVIAILGFVNYVLLKLYSARGLFYSAILGGMVNSTATIAELAGFLAPPAENVMRPAIVINLLTVLAMFLRNLLILAIFASAALPFAAAPLIMMSALSIAFIWLNRSAAEAPVGQAKLSSPLSLTKVLKFGVIFLIIEIAGTLGQRHLGHFGFLLVSIIGGLVSSASTAGAAATLAMHGQITPRLAGIGTALTSMTSALSNLPMLHAQTRQWPITRRLALLSAAIVMAGILAMVVFAYMR